MAQVFLQDFRQPSYCFDPLPRHGTDESDESNEGHEGDESSIGIESYDCERSLQRSGGVYGHEATRCEKCLEAYVGVAADQIKKNGSFKLCGALNLKLKKTAAKPARKTMRALPLKKFK